MSSFAGYCPYCRKPVMHKTLFGTLHICLLPEERDFVDTQARRSQQAQLTSMRTPDTPTQASKKED